MGTPNKLHQDIFFNALGSAPPFWFARIRQCSGVNSLLRGQTLDMPSCSHRLLLFFECCASHKAT